MLRSFLPYSFIAFSHSVSRLKACSRPAAADEQPSQPHQAKNSRQHPQHRLARVARGGRTRLCGAVCGGRLSRRRGCIGAEESAAALESSPSAGISTASLLYPQTAHSSCFEPASAARRFFVYLPLEGVFSLIGFRTAVRTCMPVLLRAGRPFLRIIMLELLHFQLIGCFLYAVNEVLVADRTMLVRLDALRRTGGRRLGRRRTAYAVRGMTTLSLSEISVAAFSSSNHFPQEQV